MFYYLRLLQDVHDSLSFLARFRQVTFRTAWAAITALAISLMFGPKMIRLLREFQIGQQIREEGPRTHQSKRGTPTMGGVLILLSVAISTLLWSDLSVAYVWIAVFSTLAFGAIGFADDLLEDQAPPQSRADRQAEARDAISRGVARSGLRSDI